MQIMLKDFTNVFAGHIQGKEAAILSSLILSKH